MSAPRSQEESEKILAPLLAELSCDLASLWLLPPDFVREVLAELPGTNAEHTQRHLAIHVLRPAPAQRTSDGEALRDYFSEREAREAEPWRREARRAQVHLDAANRAWEEEGAMAKLRAEFLAGAKGGLFTEEECLCLGYLLCCPAPAERSAFDLASLLLRVPAASRTSVHNWAVAADMPASRRDAHGQEIASTRCPLFFERPGFDVLNARLLAQCSAPGLQGGGLQSCFAPARAMLGGGALAVYGADGSQTAAVDATPLERQLLQISAAIGRLSRGGRGRGRGHRGRGRGQYRGGAGPDHEETSPETAKN